MHPYIFIRSENKLVREHIFVAEKAFGKKLPKGACVHHVDGNGKNNANNNLVICPSQEYHLLLHRRERSLNATGNPNLAKCNICKQWDSVDNLYVHSRSFQHKECVRAYDKKRRSKLPKQNQSAQPAPEASSLRLDETAVAVGANVQGDRRPAATDLQGGDKA